MGKTDKAKIEAYKSSRRSGLTPGLTAKEYQTLVNSEQARRDQTLRERNAIVNTPSPQLTLLQEFEMRYPHLTGNAKTTAFEEYEIKRNNEEDEITSRSRSRARSRARSRTRSRSHKRSRSRARSRRAR